MIPSDSVTLQLSDPDFKNLVAESLSDVACRPYKCELVVTGVFLTVPTNGTEEKWFIRYHIDEQLEQP